MSGIAADVAKRVEFIRSILQESGASGAVFGNSGGKDSALAGILCRQATDNVTGVIMPCGSRRNYDEDTKAALELAKAFDIKTLTVDLTDTKNTLAAELNKSLPVSGMAWANINPRLRMTALYALAQSTNCLVAGTGNRSERHMGYFTKWGDGAYDFNPISDLTVTEVYEYLKFLGAPLSVYDKPPSAGLFDGQTDEAEMGITYAEIDAYLLKGETNSAARAKIESYHNKTAHKRKLPAVYRQV